MSDYLNSLVCFNFYSGWRSVTALYKDVYGNDFTPQNFYTLELCELDKQITMSELSKGLDLNGSAVSTLVSRMEKKGLLIRTFGTKDRRTVFVRLTEEGHNLRNMFRSKADVFEETLRENLSEADIEKLKEIVTSIKSTSNKT